MFSSYLNLSVELSCNCCFVSSQSEKYFLAWLMVVQLQVLNSCSLSEEDPWQPWHQRDLNIIRSFTIKEKNKFHKFKRENLRFRKDFCQNFTLALPRLLPLSITSNCFTKLKYKSYLSSIIKLLIPVTQLRYSFLRPLRLSLYSRL